MFQLCCVLVTAIELVAAVFLFKERAKGTGIMVAGGVISMLGQAVYWTLPLIFGSHGVGSLLRFYYVTSAVITLGWLFFSFGLLLYALHRRGQGNRVAELEAILATIQKS